MNHVITAVDFTHHVVECSCGFRVKTASNLEIYHAFRQHRREQNQPTNHRKRER